MAIVSLDPTPFNHLHLIPECVDLYPKFFIFYRCPCGSHPPILFPVNDPFRDAILDIVAICENAHLLDTPLHTLFKGFRHSSHLHDVICCLCGGTTQLHTISYGSPSTGSRVSEATSVCVDFVHTFLLCVSFISYREEELKMYPCIRNNLQCHEYSYKLVRV